MNKRFVDKNNMQLCVVDFCDLRTVSKSQVQSHCYSHCYSYSYSYSYSLSLSQIKNNHYEKNSTVIMSYTADGRYEWVRPRADHRHHRDGNQ